LPKSAWVFLCPVCEYNHVKVYAAKAGRTAYVVCGRCRTLVTFDPAPKMGEAIDLYNLYCDAVRSRMGSHVEVPTTNEPPAAPKEHAQSLAEKSREAGGRVVFAVPLCSEHDFVIGEPIRGFQGEMLAQTRICLKCGHAERDQV
jgi:transcription elongation factor Elf1